MMTATDIMFGQNWVEQFRSALCRQHGPTESILSRVGNDWCAIDRSLTWSTTLQGRNVWAVRYRYMAFMDGNWDGNLVR